MLWWVASGAPDIAAMETFAPSRPTRRLGKISPESALPATSAPTGLPSVWPDDLAGNPAPVKLTRLRPYSFAANKAFRQRRIEREITCDGFKGRIGSRIAPADRVLRTLRVFQRPIPGDTFPLTDGTLRQKLQEL